jgi:CubicO group peptidase (beta-lactamase class C family)
MIFDRNFNIVRIALTGVLMVLGIASSPAQQPAAHAADKTAVRPESVGFSSERLERLHALMQESVDRKQIAGAVTILARHGKVVDYRTYGQRDMASAAPMTRDAIFRDYSMTKPVTGVAMMILYEQGKWLPSDPIAKYIPEFAHLKVFKGVDADGKMILVDPDHPPTMRELMSHSAGFAYGFSNTPVDALYRDAKVLQSKNLQEMIDKLAKIPLLYQPGKGWVYSASMDIEGYIAEKLSGKTLPEFMREQIFQPLGMKDAGFFVPAEKRARFATNYRDDGQSHLLLSTNSGASQRLRCAAHHALGRRRPGLHRGRLLPLCADAGQLRRVERDAHSGSGLGQADDLEPPARSAAYRRVRRRTPRDAARLRLRL